MNTFQSLGLSQPLLQAVEELGFSQPMPVQEQVIPHLLEGERDLVALAQTGTGKTAAYGLPLLQRADPENMATQAIVLSPTRELCLQIATDLEHFGRYIDGVRILSVYGGANIEPQIRALRRGVHIIVATPGRLIDLIERGEANLGSVRTVVLDEADEMLSMGFSESIDRILESIPRERKTLLFSATMSREIEHIAKRYLNNAEEIVVGSRNEGAEKVNHQYYMVRAKDKYLALKRIVDYYPNIFAIIFCRTRRETQEVADHLISDGYNAEALHGELSQAQRDLTMQKFRSHHTQLLVATDVAARGLDVDDLTHVINYGLPDDVENYTHRSGRTGRAGKKGTSICIVHVKEKGKIRTIEKVIGKAFERQALPSPKDICAKQLYKVVDELEHTQVDDEQIAPFMPEILSKLEWLSKEDLLRRMVSNSFSRFAAYYAKEQPIEEADERTSSPERKERKGRASQGERQPEAGFARLFVSLGKKNNFYARELIGMVNRHVREEIEIGRIDLMPQCSFFEVRKECADLVIAALSDVKHEGRRVVVDYASAAPAVRRGGERKSFPSSARGRRRTGDDASPRRRVRGDKAAPERVGKRPAKDNGRDDWRQFFSQNEGKKKKKGLKGKEPDFSEEGWH